MAVGDKFFAVMKNELAVSNGVATLGPDGLLNASQRPITDSMPTQGSSNPVQSGGVYSALSNKAALYLGEVGLDLLQWAAEQTSSGGFVVPPDGAQINNPAPGNWLWGKIEKPAPNRTIVRVIVDTTGIEYINHVINDAWFGWIPYATATPPQEYDLPLAEGVSGAIKYSKDQMGVVRLLGQVELATNQSGIIGIGTLPEGFYLEYAVATVCCGWPDGGATASPCTVVVNADGTVAVNAFDASLKVFAVNISFC